MRLLLTFVFSLVVLVCITAAFSQSVPAVRQPDTVTGQPGAWPQQGGKRMVDVNDLKKQANELTTMSQALPGQIDQLGNGKYPKELVDNLKKIEKQSKHIRGEVE
jgi:hypothetical protein